MRHCLSITLVCCVLIHSGTETTYASEVAKKPNKYLRYFKSPSLMTRSLTSTTPRYSKNPTPLQDSSFLKPNSAYISPRQEIAGAASLSGYAGPMMASASERSPSRIIIVRQPYSTKRSHSSSSSRYAPQYASQASSASPSIAYPYPSPYGYPGHQYMSGFNYQAPMGGNHFASQMTPYSPLVASMIAAAQRVTQSQAGPFRHQFAGSSVAPHYYSPYGLPGMQSPVYGGYAYQG